MGRFFIVIGTFVLSASVLANAQQETGSVCVAARSDDPFWKESATLPNGKINSHGLKIKVDKRPAEAWPERKSLKIEDLDISQRHVLTVIDSTGRPLESVRLNLSAYKNNSLCLSYDGYQGIGIQESSRRTPWCKCR